MSQCRQSEGERGAGAGVAGRVGGALLGGTECGEQAKCPHEPRDPPNYQNVTLFFSAENLLFALKTEEKTHSQRDFTCESRLISHWFHTLGIPQ